MFTEVAQVVALLLRNKPAVYPRFNATDAIQHVMACYERGWLIVAGRGYTVDGIVFAKPLSDGALEVEALIANNPVAVTWLFRQLITAYGDRPLTFMRGTRRARFKSTTKFFQKWAATSKQRM